MEKLIQVNNVKLMKTTENFLQGETIIYYVIDPWAEAVFTEEKEAREYLYNRVEDLR